MRDPMPLREYRFQPRFGPHSGLCGVGVDIRRPKPASGLLGRLERVL